MKDLLAAYEQSVPFYQELTDQLQTWLAALLKNQPLHIHSITGRAKAPDSLRTKIIRANGKYKALDDITDLCGIRIITRYEDEVDQVAALLRRIFTIDEANSIDKRSLLSANAFGYLSLHLIVVVTPGRVHFTHAAPAAQCKIEIQIRSLLQHAWAEIEHELAYKNNARETPAQRRHFSRLAGLLELADMEFKQLRDLAAAPPLPAAAPSTERAAAPAALPPPEAQWSLRRCCGWAAGCVVLSLAFAVALDLYCGGGLIRIASAMSTALAAVSSA